jgi:hypothetical protein
LVIFQLCSGSCHQGWWRFSFAAIGKRREDSTS